MVKVCEDHVCFLKRGTTYEWVAKEDCDLCNFESLPKRKANYVYDQVKLDHIYILLTLIPELRKKHLNKP